MLEHLTLYGTGMVYLVHHAHIHLLPKTGNSRHTGGMCLSHRLLHLLRIGIDYHRRTGIHTQDGPTTLKDMRIGQEIHDAVFVRHWHTLAVGHHGGIELAVG